jgi:hypothetical protein
VLTKHVPAADAASAGLLKIAVPLSEDRAHCLDAALGAYQDDTSTSRTAGGVR